MVADTKEKDYHQDQELEDRVVDYLQAQEAVVLLRGQHLQRTAQKTTTRDQAMVLRQVNSAVAITDLRTLATAQIILHLQ